MSPGAVTAVRFGAGRGRAGQNVGGPIRYEHHLLNLVVMSP